MKTKILFSVAIILFFNKIIAQNTWTQKADFGGAPTTLAVGFSIGNKGYIGI